MRKTPDRVNLPKLEGFRCFACGSANPIGLHMSFYLDKDAVCSDIVLNENHAGWDSVAHGGVLTTILDEIMSWTVIVFKRTFFVTRKIEVDFLRPVQVNVPLSVRGVIESMLNSRKCKATGTIFDSEGTPLTRAWGEIVYLPEKRLPLIPSPLRQEMLRLFKAIEEVI